MKLLQMFTTVPSRPHPTSRMKLNQQKEDTMRRPLLWPVLNAASLIIGAVSVLALDSRAAAVGSAIAGIAAAVCALAEGLLEKRKSLVTVLYSFSAVLSGGGFASWFFLDLGTINLLGVGATVLGVAGLLISSMWWAKLM